MTQHELFEKTFSALHASPDTLTEVRKTMRNEKKTRRALGKSAVVAIAAALTLTGLLNVMAFSMSRGTPLPAALWLLVREVLVSLPVTILIHLAFSRVHRRFAGR